MSEDTWCLVAAIIIMAWRVWIWAYLRAERRRKPPLPDNVVEMNSYFTFDEEVKEDD